MKNEINKAHIALQKDINRQFEKVTKKIEKLEEIIQIKEDEEEEGENIAHNKNTETHIFSSDDSDQDPPTSVNAYMISADSNLKPLHSFTGDGTETFSSWVGKLDDWMDIQTAKLDAQAKCNRLKFHLEGFAHSYFDQLPSGTKQDYALAKEALKTKFESDRVLNLAEQQLIATKQKYNESVGSFAARLRKLVITACSNETNEAAERRLLHGFIKKLRPQLRFQVKAALSSQSFDAALDLALKYETLLEERDEIEGPTVKAIQQTQPSMSEITDTLKKLLKEELSGKIAPPTNNFNSYRDNRRPYRKYRFVSRTPSNFNRQPNAAETPPDHVEKAIESSHSKLLCNFCRKPGHFEARCWMKFPRLRPRNNYRTENQYTERYTNISENEGKDKVTANFVEVINKENKGENDGKETTPKEMNTKEDEYKRIAAQAQMLLEQNNRLAKLAYPNLSERSRPGSKVWSYMIHIDTENTNTMEIAKQFWLTNSRTDAEVEIPEEDENVKETSRFSIKALLSSENASTYKQSGGTPTNEICTPINSTHTIMPAPIPSYPFGFDQLNSFMHQLLRGMGYGNLPHQQIRDAPLMTEPSYSVLGFTLTPRGFIPDKHVLKAIEQAPKPIRKREAKKIYQKLLTYKCFLAEFPQLFAPIKESVEKRSRQLEWGIPQEVSRLILTHSLYSASPRPYFANYRKIEQNWLGKRKQKFCLAVKKE